jgi:hypothetical protein
MGYIKRIQPENIHMVKIMSSLKPECEAPLIRQNKCRLNIERIFSKFKSSKFTMTFFLNIDNDVTLLLAMRITIRLHLIVAQFSFGLLVKSYLMTCHFIFCSFFESVRVHT